MNITNVSSKTKMLLLLFIMLFTTNAFAQNNEETAKPLTDMEVIRKVALIDIEGVYYNNVTISLKSTTPDYFLSDKYKVKIKVVDKSNKTIYKKTLKNVFLYVFSNGQIQVGKNNFNQVIIVKSKSDGDYICVVREKEGVY